MCSTVTHGDIKGRADWIRVSRQSPCLICGKPDNCMVSHDGNAIWCGRVSKGSSGENAGGQFLHFLDSDLQSAAHYVHPGHRRSPQKTTQRHSRNWEQIVNLHCVGAKPQREELAVVLGVSIASLELLRVGYNSSGSFWTFPERDEQGRVIGVNRRYRDGAKRRIRGSESGLTFCDGWNSYPGPVLLVEGASDTAALLTMGLCVVGRPSNVGGVALLADLLRSVPTDRGIVVIGERDRKPHDCLKDIVRGRHDSSCDGCQLCWPGRYGAVHTAEQITGLLNRPVGWAFPPGTAKDAREWLQQQA